MTLETATAPAAAADNTPMTADQHTAMLVEKAQPATPKRERAKPAPEPEPEEITDETTETDAADDAGEVVDAEDTEAATQADEGVEDEPTEANVEGDEDGEQAEPATPAIEPPKFWDAEGKESFAKLAPEAQRQVLKYEEQRTKAVAKAMQETAETRKSYEGKRQHLLDESDRIQEQFIDPVLPVLKEWDDWFAGPGRELKQTNLIAFLEQKAIYDDIKEDHDKAIAAKRKAFNTALADFVHEQAALIPQLVPELADEKEGLKRKTELFAYLRDEHGFEPDRLAGITAKEVQIAWKAKQFDSVKDFPALVRDAERYRKSMKLAATAPAPKPKPQAGPSAPATGQGQRLSSSEARFKALNTKNGLSQAEHTELMLLKAKLRK